VLEAGGPVEALEWLARGSRFDAVVTDFVLPKMDGARLIRHCAISGPTFRRS